MRKFKGYNYYIPIRKITTLENKKMKNLMKKLLALALVVSCVFAMASCSLFGPKPPKDLEQVAKDLEDSDDYYASWTNDEDEIDDPSVVERLYVRSEDDNLIVIVFESTKAAKLYYKSLEISYNAEIDSTKNQIKMMEYTLKHYEDKLSSDEIDELEDEIKELTEELEEMKDDFVLGRSGKRVWYGSKEILKDIK